MLLDKRTSKNRNQEHTDIIICRCCLDARIDGDGIMSAVIYCRHCD